VKTAQRLLLDLARRLETEYPSVPGRKLRGRARDEAAADRALARPRPAWGDGGSGAGHRDRAAVAVLTLSPAVRIYLATGATDLRRSIDGLAALVSERFTLDPLSGHLFLFRNRRGDRLKILAWDRSGFWILYKRLEQGTFAWPPDAPPDPVEMRSTDLALLLSGMDVAQTRRRRWYERVA
jgi:transposase